MSSPDRCTRLGGATGPLHLHRQEGVRRGSGGTPLQPSPIAPSIGPCCVRWYDKHSVSRSYWSLFVAVAPEGRTVP
eukprot:210233-Prorocentrum_minimum.AAC.1